MKMFLKNSLLLLLLFLSFFKSFAQFTSVQNGNWDDGATWGNTSPGTLGVDYPARADDVVIAHIVTVDNIGDNGTQNVGRRPDRLAENENITGVCGCTVAGGTTGCVTNLPQDCNQSAFFHQGTVDINSGGTLTSSVRMIIGGVTSVNNLGTLVLTGNNMDLFVISDLSISSGGTLTIPDNLAISASAIVNIESGSTATVGDDLFFDGDSGFLCGDGTLNTNDNVGAISNNSIRLVNSSETPNETVLDQICAETTIVCDSNEAVANQNCCPTAGTCPADLNAVAGGGGDGTISPDEDNGTTRPSTSSVLPIVLISFNTVQKEEEIMISWSTAIEIDNDYFLLERSYNLSHWQLVTRVEGNGTTNRPIEYRVSDYISDTNDRVYYRLKQVDYDGGFKYYYAKHVAAGSAEIPLVFWPNPVVDKIYLTLGNAQLRSVVIRDIIGNEVRGYDVLDEGSLVTISLTDVRLLPSVYILSVFTSQGVASQRFLFRGQ